VRVSGADAAGDDTASFGFLSLGLPSIDAVLPDGGLPRGTVVELSAPHGLARSTTLALAACASAQAEARIRGAADTEGAWCAWIDCDGSLFAPAVMRAGVDASRLLVVRPPLTPEAEATLLARVAVRVAQSGAFSVVVVDTSGVPGAARTPQRLDSWVTTVRRLALAVERSPTIVLLVTDGRAHRALPLPVAMRLELGTSSGKGVSLRSSVASASASEGGPPRLQVRVAKDRYGRVAAPVVVDIGPEPGLRAARPRPAIAPVELVERGAPLRAASA
jgi:recombination protein RecA